MLKPKGQIKVVTDNAQCYCYSVMGFRGVKHEDYHSDHYEIFFPKNVERLIEKSGIRNSRVQIFAL